ncbi:MAG: hypothetical protein OXF79_25850 [Chloroflexi bacterium]|nr:hypothetical protein [Chloroflexota bacterium]
MKVPALSFAGFAKAIAAKPRLRWGVWLILGLLLGHAMLIQSDRLAAVRHDYHAAAQRLGKAEAVLGQPDVAALLDLERKTHREIRSKFWQAETEGLAQAKLQAALDGTLSPLGLRDLHFRSGSVLPVSEPPGVWRAQLRLDAKFQPGSELRIMHALATYPKKMVVDRIDLSRPSQDGSYLVLMVSSYFVGLKTKSSK